MIARSLVGEMNTGTIGTAGRRIAHGLEVFREGRRTPYVVSFVNVDGWRAEMRLALEHGHLVVSDLHVTPQTDQARAGGLKSRQLRQVPVHAHLEKVAEMLRRPYQREQLE